MWVRAECHTEQSRSTWNVGLSALLVQRKDLGRVLLVNRFDIPDPNPKRNPQAVGNAATLVDYIPKQNLDAV